MKEKQTLNVKGKKVELSNLLKELWPDKKITKFHLVQYYLDIYLFLKPHLEHRPLIITRYPEGIDQKGFYQKDIKKVGNLPEWIKTIDIVSGSREDLISYLLVDHPATMVWLGNLGAVELHPWLSRVMTLDYPDYVVFDLDPMPKADFSSVRLLAFSFKEHLEKYEIKSYPKLTGSRGIQLFVPIEPIYSYTLTRNFAKKVCIEVLKKNKNHEMATIERTVKKRDEHKVYLDYLQNVKGKTLSAIYGVRARPGAYVSTPITWPELKLTSTSQLYNIFSIKERVKEVGDLFLPVLTKKQRLPDKIIKSLE